MASTREQLRSEISFRDEVIRESCLKERTEKLNELSPFTDGMAYAPAGSASSQIVSALIHGINEWAEKSRHAQHTRVSAMGGYCCKSRKSNNPKNLAKVDLWTSPLLRRFSAPPRRS